MNEVLESIREHVKYQKQKNIHPAFYNPIPIFFFFFFLEGEIASQRLNCFHMAVIINVSLFFTGKVITIFPCFSPSVICFYYPFEWLHNIPFRGARNCLCKQALSTQIHIWPCFRLSRGRGRGGLQGIKAGAFGQCQNNLPEWLQRQG